MLFVCKLLCVCTSQKISNSWNTHWLNTDTIVLSVMTFFWCLMLELWLHDWLIGQSNYLARLQVFLLKWHMSLNLDALAALSSELCMNTCRTSVVWMFSCLLEMLVVYITMPNPRVPCARGLNTVSLIKSHSRWCILLIRCCSVAGFYGFSASDCLFIAW